MTYFTIAGSVETELEVQRSRFIARLERVGSEAEARSAIQAMRARHPRANHHCTAFVLGPGSEIQRSNDDGEPGGTAGAPMLNALTAAGMSDIVAIVTRYFGGQLLGAGGLTRAYGSATAQALAEAPRVRRELRQSIRVTSGYDLAPLIEAEARRRGVAVGAADYAEHVRQEFWVAEDECTEFAAVIAEISQGSVTPEFGPARYQDMSS